MNRAHALFSIKAFDEQARTFEGIATTPSPDRMTDVVEPKGAKFTLPLPFLYQHHGDKPLGHVLEARVKSDGIHVKGMVEKVETPPTLKERFDVAWAEMKLGLVRGLSIGFNPTKWEPIKDTDYGLRFLEWDWLELSLVTIPANAEATLTNVKQFDTCLQRTAPGQQIARKGVLLIPTASAVAPISTTHPGAVLLLKR